MNRLEKIKQTSIQCDGRATNPNDCRNQLNIEMSLEYIINYIILTNIIAVDLMVSSRNKLLI